MSYVFRVVLHLEGRDVRGAVAQDEGDTADRSRAHADELERDAVCGAVREKELVAPLAATHPKVA